MIQKYFLSLLAVVTFISYKTAAQKYSFDNPAAYNNHIAGEQNLVLEKSINYSIQSVHSDDEHVNNSLRLEVIRQIDQSIGELKNTATYKSDAGLRDESIEVLTLYKEAFSTEFQEVNSLKKSSQDSFEAMEKYFRAQDRAENKLNHASKKFAKAQFDFASKYNLIMEQGSMHEDLDVITRVNQYSRALFLEQFKVSKTNAAFLEALNVHKSGGLEGKRKELQDVSIASLNIVNAIAPYKGEENFKTATLNLIGYFKINSGKEYLEMENILKNPKPESKEIEKFNQMVIQMNEESSRLIQEFNKAHRAFLRENIPYNN
jgi:hypothetical protein